MIIFLSIFSSGKKHQPHIYIFTFYSGETSNQNSHIYTEASPVPFDHWSSQSMHTIPRQQAPAHRAVCACPPSVGFDSKSPITHIIVHTYTWICGVRIISGRYMCLWGGLVRLPRPLHRFELNWLLERMQRTIELTIKYMTWNKFKTR